MEVLLDSVVSCSDVGQGREWEGGREGGRENKGGVKRKKIASEFSK
jgi:hypothetical protein